MDKQTTIILRALATGMLLLPPVADTAMFRADSIIAGCSVLSLSGRQILCDGNAAAPRITLDANIAPGCPRFALGTQGANYTLVCSTPNWTGLWWSPAIDGRGVWVSHQADTVFAVAYDYSNDGAPTWRTLTATKNEAGLFVGTVYATTGPPLSAATFDPRMVWPHRVGAGWVALDDADPDHLRVNFAGAVQGPLVRQAFGALPTCQFGATPDIATATNATDLWWNPDESGWGVSLTHQDDTIFAAWYAYRADSNSTWFVSTMQRTNAGTSPTYAGTLYSAVGPAPPVQAAAVGTATLTVVDGNAADFSYTVGSVAQTKRITRQVFSAPGAACQ